MYPYNSTRNYLELMKVLSMNPYIPRVVVNALKAYEVTIYESDEEKRYGAPMEAIGWYIAIASLFCILAMVADLLHGTWTWFPCKYFSLNAVTLVGIAVAMKLPVDLSGSFPGDVDQAAKLGSMAFMCTMMANFLPCLAAMDSNELLTNITALVVLVITLVVNVCIQIHTGGVGNLPSGKTAAKLFLVDFSPEGLQVFADLHNTIVAIIYVISLLSLLIIHVSLSLVILKSKQIIESRYQTASKNVHLQRHELMSVAHLQQHVSKYWIMAVTGSPQFISACSVTTTAAGVICVFTSNLHAQTLVWTISNDIVTEYDSAYKKTTLLILVVQSIGVLCGTVAPLFRCFASMRFKLSIKNILNQIKVFKVEKYWTQKLSEWKYGSISLPLPTISLPSGNHNLKMVIRTLKNLILMFCIILQMGVVVVCKIIALIPFFLMLCLHCFKWLFQCCCSSSRGVENDRNLEQPGQYVLQLESENELTESTLKYLLKSLDLLIQKSETRKPKNLMNLIVEKSTKGFQGVMTFDKVDDHHVQRSSSSIVEYRDCWSLSVVTLTTIAITLPNVENVRVKRLLKSVREGLAYITLIEEILINSSDDDYESIQKAAKTLWEEVDFRHKWLGIKLKDIACEANSQVDNTLQVVHSFLDKADKKIKKAERPSPDVETMICAKSMYRIAKTIRSDNERNEITNLFDQLSSKIVDIIAACLTNLPQAIAMKCHTSVIEKREASVKVAAKLLGETKEIINTLKEYDVPSMSRDDGLPFIDKWRAYLSRN